MKKRYDFDVEVIKKTDWGLLKKVFLPRFPSVEIDGHVVFECQDITLEDLEKKIISLGIR